MPEITTYEHGTPSWVDLATTDLPEAEKFYGSLFGWEKEHSPIGDDQVYSMQKLRGKYVAAIYEQMQEQKEQGLPPHWGTYIAVNDVDSIAARVKKLGGTVVVEPMDVMDAGRMSLLMDPEGAVFAVWQAKEHQGAGLVNEAGTLCWNELVASDIEKSAEYYSELFGVSAEDMSGPMEYKMIKVGENQVAGIFKKTPEMKDMSSYWSVYFAVDDCDATVEKAKKMNAEVLVSPTDFPSGRFAMLRDPQGATFSVIKLNDAM
jgi:predicted enzyme related to lactoylglutathione lyase